MASAANWSVPSPYTPTCGPVHRSRDSGLPLTQPSPSYQRPPVAEVALGIYFSPALDLRAVHMGQLWDRWRDRYPQVQDQSPLSPVLPETFPSPLQAVPFQFVGGFPGIRVWYMSELGDQLVQVQPDRLVLNWRRIGQDQPYPRYEVLRPTFVREAQEFIGFLGDIGLGEAAITQAEVTYINPISLQELGDPLDLSRLISPWSGRFSDSFLPLPEDTGFRLRFRIPEPASGEPVGRLYVEGNPAIHQTLGGEAPEEVFMLQLFARGRPLGSGLDGALAFLDLGHDWVVRGFTSLTAEPMHSEWGRER